MSSNEAPQQKGGQQQQLEYNTRYKSYILICITSLTNFISINEVFNIPTDHTTHYYVNKHPKVQQMFGIVTFTCSLLILIFDLIGFIRNKFDYKSLCNGKVEGWTLLSFVIWWICGVVSITRAGSIGYASLNIYFSAWFSLAACIDALDKWGGEKDILTVYELTRLSITLPSWWIVFWASIVILGSGADARHMSVDQFVRDSCDVAIGISSITTIVSAFFVLSHYEFMSCCQACSSNSWMTYGGWFELACSILVNIWLVIELEQLTGAGSIASTITGNGGNNPDSDEYVPGTNIYLAIWAAFIASIRVTVKWKEARAIRFAKTGGIKSDEEEEEEGVGDKETAEIENENEEVGA